MWYKILILAAITILWWYGGQIKNRYRDVGVPLILFAYFSYSFGISTGFWVFVASNLIRMGYGRYSPEEDPEPSHLAQLTKDRRGHIIRGLWGLLVSMGLLVALKGNIALYKLCIYVLYNTLINYMVSKFKWSIKPTDISVALSYGSIILYV